MTHSCPPLPSPDLPPEMTLHGKTLSDPYHWLKDESYPVIDDKDVLDYVKAENAYFDAAMKPHAALVETLFQEMKGHIKEADSSVPRSEEHTSELQSLMRNSYAVFC